MAPRIRVAGIDRICLVASDARQLALFYVNAFGARIVPSAHADDAPTRVLLAIGTQRVELVSFDRPGQPYPAYAQASDLAFQHFAIVVADIDAAYRHLMAMSSWTPITLGGPQRLPASSGGVWAFKFRDPAGHPLELLQFPAPTLPLRWRCAGSSANVLGLDHTAISVADSDTSIEFYASLGFAVTARSINQGATQDRLDGLKGVKVEVTALSASEPTPHLELLCYRTRSAPAIVGPHDVAATRIVLRSDSQRVESLTDPDGHLVEIGYRDA